VSKAITKRIWCIGRVRRDKIEKWEREEEVKKREGGQ
jgi:hypothetical protein